ncbi:MAG: hypothetical protein R3C11_21680 [Planctomycetaceae bacterium]
MRTLLHLVLIVILSGCSVPEKGEALPQNDNELAEQSGDAAVDRFIEELQSQLEKRDWQAVRNLHWSGMEITKESLQEQLEPLLEKVGPTSGYTVTMHNKYDKETYQNYIDREEIPGPPELLRGSIEFSIKAADENSPWLNL